jgi:hypothetical protein
MLDEAALLARFREVAPALWAWYVLMCFGEGSDALLLRFMGGSMDAFRREQTTQIYTWPYRHILLAAGGGGATDQQPAPPVAHQPPFTLAFDGLASFVDGRGELRVLYAKVRRLLAYLLAYWGDGSMGVGLPGALPV